MKTKLLIGLLVVGVVLIAGCAYFMLEGAPAGELPSENVPSGVVTKAGTLEQDETWSGEICVTDHVFVPEGITLTIEPGTVIKFKHYKGYKEPWKRLCIGVKGTLKAIGTPEKQIWFTSDASDPVHGDWGTIHIAESKGNIIDHAIVEYAFMSIEFWTASGTVSNSIIRWITSEGIYMERSNPTIENNTIYGTGFNGIAMEQFNENVIIRYNRIENNQGAGIHGEATKATLENNVVANNRFGITFDDYSEVDLKHNLIENNSEEGLHFIVETKANLVFNEIKNNKIGIISAEGSWLTAHNNDIYNNTEIALEAYDMQQLDVENNWWGTVDSASIRENIQSDQEVSYGPFLTGGVVDISEPIFDYQDVKKTELGYIPGDPEDMYPYVYDNEDETRRVVKKIGENLMFGWSLAWDGEYLWRFTCAGGGGLIKVDPENGEIVASFPNPGIAQDRGIAFDGKHLWINDFSARKVFEVDPANGEVISSFDIPEMGSGSSGIAWDGEYLYLVDWLRADQPGAPLYKVDRQGNLIGTIELEEGGGASITFDGENFWVTPSGRGIRKYDMHGGLVGEIYAAAFGGEAIAHDGEYLWVLHRTQELWKDPKLYQIEILNDTILLEN